MDYKFTFVVLHFMTFDDTVECVDSILNNIKYENYSIVIVDNGSPNQSGKLVLEKYQHNPKIKIILSDKNLGFAQGNNLGFKYAKYELNSDFISLINNDTIIEQSDFITKIVEEYKYHKFHILGPDILSTKDGIHQNPAKIRLKNENELRLLIKVYYVKLFLNYFFIDDLIEKSKKMILKKTWIKTGEDYTPSWKEKKENVKLHGSALVFSKDYINLYEGLYPKTFMHSEEAIIYFIVKRDNLRTVYCPDIQILHKEDSSTEAVYNKGFRKRRFYYKNFIKSGKVFLELIEETKKNG